MGSKVKYLNFAVTQSFDNILLNNACRQRYNKNHWLGAKVHFTPCVDLYSGRIIVFFYDLDDSLCLVTCVIMFWT